MPQLWAKNSQELFCEEISQYLACEPQDIKLENLQVKLKCDMKVFFMDDCSKVSRVSSATIHRALIFLINQEPRFLYSNDLFDDIQWSGRAQVQCQPIKMQENRPSLNQHQRWMPSGFDCDVFKLVKIT